MLDILRSKVVIGYTLVPAHRFAERVQPGRQR